MSHWWNRRKPDQPLPDASPYTGTLTEWWVGEIKGGRVLLTHDLYWCLLDLATREGYSPDQFKAFKLKKPVRDLVNAR